MGLNRKFLVVRGCPWKNCQNAAFSSPSLASWPWEKQSAQLHTPRHHHSAPQSDAAMWSWTRPSRTVSWDKPFLSISSLFQACCHTANICIYITKTDLFFSRQRFIYWCYSTFPPKEVYQRAQSQRNSLSCSENPCPSSKHTCKTVP